MKTLQRLILLALVSLAPVLAYAQAIDVIGVKPEDSTVNSGDRGLPILVQRLAACGTSSAIANGKYAVINSDANGNLCFALAASSVGSATGTDSGSAAAGQANAAITLNFPYVYNGTNWERKVGFHLTDDDPFTPGATGVAAAGFFADETATDSVDEGDTGAARMTLDRKQIVTSQPHTQGGLTIYRSLDLDETEEAVKATRGQLYGIWFTNTATSTRFMKCYDATVASVVVGTTVPVITIPLPGNTSDDITGALSVGGQGIEFVTAITCAATTALADTDTGAPSTGDVIANFFIK